MWTTRRPPERRQRRRVGVCVWTSQGGNHVSNCNCTAPQSVRVSSSPPTVLANDPDPTMPRWPCRLAWMIVVYRFFSCFSQSYAQQISTSTPVPPLQWLNITGLLQGSPAPPLKYASIGYDDTTRNLIIFGGQASSGIPTAQTFLYDPTLLPPPC